MNYREDSLANILNDVHDKMKNKLTYITQENEAKEIEELLREIKITALNSKNTNLKTMEVVEDEVLSLIQQTWKEQIKIHRGYRSSNPTNLFQRKHKYNTKTRHYTIKQADDIFEEELAFLLQAAGKRKGLNLNVDITLVGQKQNTTSAIQTGKQFQMNMKDMTKEAAKNFHRSVEAASKISGTAFARPGKVDLKTPTFTIQGGETFTDRLLRAFSGKTFSLKNYSSFKTIENKIVQTKDPILSLGDSNVYKAITGSLSTIYSDVETQNIIYYRGMQYLSKLTNPPDSTSTDIVQKHFAHLRFVYELKGQGLITDDGENMVADFIIWNDPFSEKIIVRSTNQLINRLSQNYTNPFAQIRLKTTDLFPTTES